VASLVAAAMVLSLGLAFTVAGPAAAGSPCSSVCGAASAGALDVAGGAIPGIGAVTSLIGGVAGDLTGAASSIASSLLEDIGEGIATAVASVLSQVSAFMTASTRPDVTAASFVGADGAYHKVAQLAAVLMVLFLFIAVVQGTLSGEPGQMLARIIRDVPLAVLAIFGLPWLVDQLLTLVDQVCAWILPSGPTLTTIAQVYGAGQVRAVFGGFSLPAILCELFAFLGGIGIYAELVVRSALVTLVVALAPLSFAVMAWPWRGALPGRSPSC